MKVVLVGYMASGKTTIGKGLARKLCLPFIDLDQYIEKKEKSTITKIFKTKGEIYFRKLENKYVSELLLNPNSFILSLGGGTPCYSGNMDLLLQSEAKIIYLKANILTLVKRINKNKSKRPLVSQIDSDDLPEFVGKHLFERSDYYERAPIKIIIDNKNKEETINDIWFALH